MEMKKRITITVGLGFTGGNIPLSTKDLELGTKIADTEILRMANGYTQSDDTGAWCNDAGGVVREPVRVYTILAGEATSQKTIKDLSERIRHAFGQDSVLVTVEDIHAVFV